MPLNNIYWAFNSKVYHNPEDFNSTVKAYQQDIAKTTENWKPNEILFDVPEIQIQYEAWLMQPNDLLPNDELIDDDANVFEEEADEDGYQVEIVARLKADNGKNFNALEFLMKTHNQLANKELGDHVFFEGTADATMIDGLPTYYIYCGS